MRNYHKINHLQRSNCKVNQKGVFTPFDTSTKCTIFVPKHCTIMALINKRLTPGEIAACYYHVFGNCNDWTLLYAIADGIKDKHVYDINRNTVSKWKSMDKITGLISDLKRVKSELQQGPGTDNNKDSERTEIRPKLNNSKLIDYSDPAAQMAKLNELVNTADDSGDVLDALKVIISGQRADRDAAKDGRTVRAYVPVSCSDCPMYQKARKKVSI